VDYENPLFYVPVFSVNLVGNVSSISEFLYCTSDRKSAIRGVFYKIT